LHQPTQRLLNQRIVSGHRNLQHNSLAAWARVQLEETPNIVSKW
jgi:hypothetical protein